MLFFATKNFVLSVLFFKFRAKFYYSQIIYLMKKFLLTLVAAFAAFGAFAQDYPVVTSVDELKAQPEGTMVKFENIEVKAIVDDSGWYPTTYYYLSDETTRITGEIYPYPAEFTAIGSLQNVDDWDGSYSAFVVDSVCSVSKFTNLADMIQYQSMNDEQAEAIKNSSTITAVEGTAIVTAIWDNYIFYTTSAPSDYGYNSFYGVMEYADAKYFNIGDELAADGGFCGTLRPTYATYDEDWKVVEFKGHLFTVEDACYVYKVNYGAQANISYSPYALTDIDYMAEGQAVRLAAGGTLVERDGKYYYETSAEVEEYIDGEWIWITKTLSVQVVSKTIDLSQYAGTVMEDFLAGVWDKANTGDENRLILNELISKVQTYDNIGSFLAKGEQYEEEIVTKFANPVVVTYIYKDQWKYVIMVQDATGALFLDYSAVAGTEEEAVLDAIKVGDNLVNVQGYPQFVVANAAPCLMGAIEDWSTYPATVISFLPEVESSGNPVKPRMTVTVGDMLQEWANCQNNSTMPTIANNVVSVIDAQVLDTLDQWGDPVKYLIQGTDTMELSNLWGENKMNFSTFERNNIVGIADYCRINSNSIYQLQPLSQEHITDASIVPEVTSIDELKNYVGMPVIYKGAEVQFITPEGSWYGDYFLGDGSTYVYGFTYQGKFDLKGIYNEDEWGGNFEVFEMLDVVYFSTLSDVFTYVTAAKEAGDEVIPAQAFEVNGPSVVTYVDGENVFVQFLGQNAWGGTANVGTVIKGVKTAVKIGDEIKGLKGVATPADAGYDADWVPYFNTGSSFALAEDATITVVSSDNEIQHDYTVESPAYIEYNASTYSALPVRMGPGGEIVKEGEQFFYVATDAKDGTQSQIECASNVVDLNTLVGAPLGETTLLTGVLDLKNTSNEAMRFLVTGTGSTLLEYQNIAEMTAAGEQQDYSMTSVLVNPVTVTHKYIEIGEWSNTLYLVVEDETGALGIQLQDVATMDLVEVGSQIQNVKGIVGKSWLGYYWLMGYDQDNWGLDLAFDVLETKAEVVPAEMTLAELAADAAVAQEAGAALAWRLVKVTDVTIVPEGEKDAYYTQGEDFLSIPRTTIPMFEGMTTVHVTGIVDPGVLNANQFYTILPRSAEDINDITALNDVVVEGGIYLNDAYQVVATGAVAVEVYDLNGRVVAAANAATVDAEALAQGVYVVRATYADGAVKAAKVVR